MTIPISIHDSEPYIRANKLFSSHLGDIPTILLSTLIYLDTKKEKQNGYFDCSEEEIKVETELGETTQRKHLGKLKKLGLVSIKRKKCRQICLHAEAIKTWLMNHYPKKNLKLTMENSLMEWVTCGGYCRVYKKIIYTYGLKLGMVYGSILDCLNRKGIQKWVHIGVDVIQRVTGYSQHTQNQAISQLVALGLISRRYLNKCRFLACISNKPANSSVDASIPSTESAVENSKKLEIPCANIEKNMSILEDTPLVKKEKVVPSEKNERPNILTCKKKTWNVESVSPALFWRRVYALHQEDPLAGIGQTTMEAEHVQAIVDVITAYSSPYVCNLNVLESAWTAYHGHTRDFYTHIRKISVKNPVGLFMKCYQTALDLEHISTQSSEKYHVFLREIRSLYKGVPLVFDGTKKMTSTHLDMLLHGLFTTCKEQLDLSALYRTWQLYRVRTTDPTATKSVCHTWWNSVSYFITCYREILADISHHRKHVDSV